MSSKTYSTQFRISLPSNVNRAMYPDNLAGKFTVELPVTIQLDHGLEWELALKEIFWLVSGQKPPGHKPPDKTPRQKPPGQTPPNKFCK